MRQQTGNHNMGNQGSQSHQAHTTGNRGHTTTNNQANNANRGFASMSDEKHKAVSSKGGKAAHDTGQQQGNRDTHTSGKKESPAGPSKNK